MPRSFFTFKKDSEIATGSAVFNSLISASPTTYGLTTQSASSYSTAHNAFVDALNAAGNPATKNTALVFAKNQARKNLVELASSLAKIIDGTPTVTDEQKLDLGLNVRKTPEPRPAPGKPYEFKAELDGNGDLILKWKCDNPAGTNGTVYQIFRRFDGVGEYDYVGGAGQRRYVDTSVPQGTKWVTYQLQAIRSTAAGLWAEFNVNFGKAINGTSVASVTETTPAKLAA